jgi:hypothetical protein
VCYVRLKCCYSTAGVATKVAAGVLPEGRWMVGAIELGYGI